MLIETLSRPFALARQVNETSAAFRPKIPTNTEPVMEQPPFTATGISISMDRGQPGQHIQNGAIIVPFGLGTNGQTFSIRFWSWRPIGENNPGQLTLWVPVLLAEIACTLDSTVPGIANTYVPANNLFANTISLTTGNNNISIDITNPAAAGQIANALVDLKGAQKLELCFKVGTATSGNALVSLI